MRLVELAAKDLTKEQYKLLIEDLGESDIISIDEALSMINNLLKESEDDNV